MVRAWTTVGSYLQRYAKRRRPIIPATVSRDYRPFHVSVLLAALAQFSDKLVQVTEHLVHCIESTGAGSIERFLRRYVSRRTSSVLPSFSSRVTVVTEPPSPPSSFVHARREFGDGHS